MDQFNKIKNASRSKKIHYYKELRFYSKKISLNIWFLRTCISRGLVPKFISLKTCVASASARRALQTGQLAWLESELHRWFKIRDFTEVKIGFLHLDLSSTLHPVVWDAMDSSLRDDVWFFGVRNFNRLRNKVDILIRQKRFLKPDSPHRTRFSDYRFHARVLNISDSSIPERYTRLLSKGLKFSPHTPFVTRNQLSSLVTDSEVVLSNPGSRHLNKVVVGAGLADIVKKFNRAPSTSSRSGLVDFSVLRELSHFITVNNLVVSKADKGNCVVIMNKIDYLSKTESFLSGPSFQKLNKDPTNSYQRNLKECLKATEDTLSHFNIKAFSIVSSNPRVPCLYSLPKIHKDNIPVRPIVSFIGSPTYLLSKELNRTLLSNVSFSSPFSIKNSIDLVSKLSSLTVPPNSFLVSFDVANLFPSVPLDQTLSLVRELLFDSTLRDADADNLFRLLCLCARQNYFIFNQNIYLQTSGLSMGSPLSPLLAEIFMSWLETSHISTSQLFKTHVLYWFRYVDDIICLFRGDESDLARFLSFINSLHDNITFTVELSKNNTIPFLDLMISVVDSKHSFKIYRKPTFTDSIIPYNSCHHPTHKFASLSCFIHRLLTIPLSRHDFVTELNIIRQIAINNGFPLSVFNALYNKKLSRYQISANFALTSDKVFTPVASLPFVGGISLVVQRFLRSRGVDVTFKTPLTLGSCLVRTKDKVDDLDYSGIYKLACSCGKFYIGRTIRSFKVRFKEHFRERNSFEIKSNFTRHVVEENHDFPPDCLQPLHKLHKRKTIEFREILEISKYRFLDPDNILNDQVEFDNVRVIPLILDVLV